MLRFAGPIFMVWMMLVIPATAGTNAIVIKLSSASSVVHGGDDVVLDLCLIALIATKAPPEAWIGQQVPIDQGQILAQSFLNDLSVNAPMYFLLGVEPGLQQSKFQFSFKYRLFNPDGYIAEKASWVSKFHFGKKPELLSAGTILQRLRRNIAAL